MGLPFLNVACPEDVVITVVTASFAHLFLDSPTLIAMYYLPYENEELKKVVLFSRHCSSLN